MNLSLWLNIVIEVLKLIVGHLSTSGTPQAVVAAHAALDAATTLKQTVEAK